MNGKIHGLLFFRVKRKTDTDLKKKKKKKLSCQEESNNSAAKQNLQGKRKYPVQLACSCSVSKHLEFLPIQPNYCTKQGGKAKLKSARCHHRHEWDNSPAKKKKMKRNSRNAPVK